jgi:hypothetical protein
MGTELNHFKEETMIYRNITSLLQTYQQCLTLQMGLIFGLNEKINVYITFQGFHDIHNVVSWTMNDNMECSRWVSAFWSNILP